MSTHHMDEADLLGDRIAIIKEGNLITVGSSVSLRAEFGNSYYLTIVRDRTDSEEFIDQSMDLVRQHVPEAKLFEKRGEEIVIILPTSSMHSFHRLLVDLQQNSSRLNILGHGISDSSLEEIFLRVTGDNDSQAKVQTHQNSEPLPKVEFSERPLFVSQMMGLLEKQFKIIRRSKLHLFVQVFLPLAICSLFLVPLVTSSLWTNPQLEMSPWIWPYGESDPEALHSFLAVDNTDKFNDDIFVEQFLSKNSMGTKCIPGSTL